VKLSRALAGVTAEHYSFDLRGSTLLFINARGAGRYTAWPNPGDVASKLTLLRADGPTCACDLGITGTLGGLPLHKSCPPPPLSDLALQHNPTCSIETYLGGLSCARHLEFLLDKNQSAWDGNVQEYHLKYRFYFRMYDPAKMQGLVRFYHQTEADAGEYDVMQCRPGTPAERCVQTITSRWSVKDMINPCDTHPVISSGWCAGNGSADPTKVEGIQLIYAGPHCHAPSCVSMELYLANTGELLCGMRAEYGTGGNELYDELGYAVLPPCVWGPCCI
jgi:hypothetical protein